MGLEVAIMIIDLVVAGCRSVTKIGMCEDCLLAAKKKHHIGPLKNKQQLIDALQKAAGEEMAEKAKKETLDNWS